MVPQRVYTRCLNDCWIFTAPPRHHRSNGWAAMSDAAAARYITTRSLATAAASHRRQCGDEINFDYNTNYKSLPRTKSIYSFWIPDQRESGENRNPLVGENRGKSQCLVGSKEQQPETPSWDRLLFSSVLDSFVESSTRNLWRLVDQC